MSDPKKTSAPASKAPAKADADAPTLAAAVASANARNPNIVDEKVDTATMSSVGAQLAPEANTFTEDGVTVLDAGGPHLAAAPLPTPAEAVAYPATGGLPDTGPNSKYVMKEVPVVELFNREGVRVDRDGMPIDPFGDRIPLKGEKEVLMTDVERADVPVPSRTKEEMNAGKRALGGR